MKKFIFIAVCALLLESTNSSQSYAHKYTIEREEHYKRIQIRKAAYAQRKQEYNEARYRRTLLRMEQRYRRILARKEVLYRRMLWRMEARYMRAQARYIRMHPRARIFLPLIPIVPVVINRTVNVRLAPIANLVPVVPIGNNNARIVPNVMDHLNPIPNAHAEDPVIPLCPERLWIR